MALNVAGGMAAGGQEPDRATSAVMNRLVVALLWDATSKDAMKLRKTGFEFSQSFVIRLAENPGGFQLLPPERGMGPAIGKRGCLGISLKFDEFPNQLWCGKKSFGEALSPLAFVFITQN